MRIQHNIMAMNAYRNLGTNNTSLGKNLEKLSSGYRINRAGDDAAGLAISEKMRAQISGLDQAQKNAQSGINLVKTAEGALTEVHDMLNRMVTLATQSANGTYVDSDRSKIQAEVDALIEEIDRIADNSNFNGQKLLNGELSTSKTYVFEADADATNNKAAVDFSLKVGQYDSDADDKVDSAAFTIELADTTGTAGAQLSKTSNTLTITLKAGTNYTAEDIQNLVRGATSTGFSTTNAAEMALEDSMLDSLSKAIVSGNGITAKSTDTTFGTTASTDNFGGEGKALTLQIGADAVEAIEVGVDLMSAIGLGITGLNIGDVDNANKAIDTIKAAIESVSVTRGNLGAIQNRLEHTINNLGVMEENIQDAESVIRDTDVADEMMAYTKNNILIQSAQAMLAQANQVPQGVLQLMQ